MATKKIAKPTEETLREMLDEWRMGELFKIAAMKNQLKRPDSYLKIKENLGRVDQDVTVDEVGEVVDSLLQKFDEVEMIVKGASVESVTADIDYDPYRDMFSMVEKGMGWKEIVVEEIYFETIRPFADHYFTIAEQIAKAKGDLDGAAKRK